MYRTPRRNAAHSGNAEFHTPLSFSKELKQVLNERNLLTAKSRKKICSLLENAPSPLGSERNDSDKRHQFRLQAIEEIVKSEKNYLSQLEVLMRFFVLPLKDQAIINDASHTTLFGQIEIIYNLNGELLKELETDLENVGKAFLKMAPFFKLYSVYAFDYKNALLILQDLTSKNPVFRKFLENTESRPEVQSKLNSLMIVPIQRVPRYKLLLEQVLMYTSPAEADFKILKESVKQVQSTCAHINSVIEDQEVTLMLINLQNSLLNRTPSIVKPSRKVIKEGILEKVTRNGSLVKRYCVIMSDIFMYCKILKDRTKNTHVENSLECCCIFPLKKCKVYELFPGNFKITCQGDGVILCTTDQHLGQNWVSTMKDAIELHIQCRKTLRKESSKRSPMRKKDVKNFGADSVLSPGKRKYEYETVFRNKGTSDSDDDSSKTSSFNLGKLKSKHMANEPPKKRQRPNSSIPKPTPPPPPPTTTQTASITQPLSTFHANSQVSNYGTANSDHDPTYGFANRFSDTKSYFRTHNVDSTIPSTIDRDELFGNGQENNPFKDMLFPLRSSGGSSKSGNWSVPAMTTPPQRKRVKFDSPVYQRTPKPQPFQFPSTNEIPSTKTSLRQKIVDFFSKIF